MGKLIVPDDRLIVPSPVVHFEGLFAGRARDRKGRIRRSFGFAVPNNNLIVNLGLDRLGGWDGGSAGVQPGFSHMLLGTSTTPPSVTDSAMAAFGVSVRGLSGGPNQTLQGNGGPPTYYGWMRGRWTSDIGGATGNWTNIAISSSPSNAANSLRSSALILDNSGNPTSFPVLADEQFEGFWELRAYVNLADTTYTINVGATPTDCTQRPSYVASNSVPTAILNHSGAAVIWLDGQSIRANGNLGAITAGMTGLITDGHYPSFVPVGAYVPGSYEQLYRATSSPTQAVGTFNGLSRQANQGIGFQTRFVPSITKTNTESLTYYQKFTWARR